MSSVIGGLSEVADRLRIDELAARSVVPFAVLLLVAMIVGIAAWRLVANSQAKQHRLAPSRIPVQIMQSVWHKR